MGIRISLIFCCVLTATGVGAGTVTTTTLPNGMQVRVHADAELALTSVNLLLAAGRANDPDSLAGLAHLAEHLMTESSRDHPRGGLIRQTTLYSTYRNAYTSNSFMGFVTQCLPQFLPRVLALEAERFQEARLDENGFAREKSVVLEEMAYRKRRTPWSAHLEELHQACYRGHPLGQKVGGSRESIGRITLADYEAFRERNVKPCRATLVVSGPLAVDRTLSLVDSLFRAGPQAVPEHVSLPPYPPVRPIQVVGDAYDFTGVRVSVACRVPLKDDTTAVLAYSLPDLLDLGLGVSSVPGEAMIEFGGRFNYYRPPPDAKKAFGYIYDDFDPDQTAQYALGALWRELDREVDELADPDLFAKRQQNALANASSFGTDIDAGAAMANGNRTVSAERAATILASLTYADVGAFVSGFVNPDRAAVGVTHGRDSERPQAVELAARSKREADFEAGDALSSLHAAEIEPVLAIYGKADLRPIARATLGNGVPFLYLELPGLSRMRLGGTRTLPPLKVQRPGDKPGIAQLYSVMVDYDDRQHREPDEINYRPRKLPYDLDFKLQPGQLVYGGQAREAKFARLAFHLARRLDSREFNQERWFRLTRSGGAYLAGLAANPEVQACGWRLGQVLHAEYPDVGYWRPDPAIMDKISYKDLVKVHRKAAGETGQTILYGVGSLPLAEVVPILEETLGRRDKYRAREAVSPPPDGPSAVTGQVVPDLTRGDVLLSLAFPATRQAPVPAELLLETLLAQRLMSRLREREGLTYAAWVTRSGLSGWTLWELNVTCRPGQAPAALVALKEELVQIDAGGFSPDEFARARLRLTGDLIRACTDPQDGFNLLGRLAACGPLPENLLATIAQEDAGGVNALANNILSANRFAFTALGPLLEEDIERFVTE